MRALAIAVVLALVLASGCSKIFGIDQIPFAGDAGGVPQDVIPADAAPAEKLLAGSPSFDFGSVVVGNSSFGALVDITNVGDASTGMLAASPTGDTTSFAIVPGSCNGATLAPGDACTLMITFSPAAPGTLNASIDVGDGAASASVSLTGIGLEPGALDIEPSLVSFGTHPVASSNNTHQIQLKNTGMTPLVLMAIQLTGDGASYVAMPDANCAVNQTLDGGATCLITIDFRPQSGGAHPASLVVTTNASANPMSSASLGGTGSVTVNVAKGGNGTGFVKSSDGSIACGATCTATFTTAMVTLTSTADPQNAFMGWSPNCATQGTTCSLMSNAPTIAVAAAFAEYVNLAVAVTGSEGEVTGGGIDCTNAGEATCMMGFPPGSMVQLTPTAQDPSAFNLWGAACANENIYDSPAPPSCILTMNADTSVTADFASDFVLDLIPSPSSIRDPATSLTVNGVPCDPTVGCTTHWDADAEPVSVEITATGTSCTVFSQFYGGCNDLFPDCLIDFSNGPVVVVDYEFVPGTGMACPD